MVSFARSRGGVIVPVHLAEVASVRRLEETLRTLPSFVGRVIVVVQAEGEPLLAFESLARERHLACVVLGRPVGKWPAFAAGLSLLSGTEQWVAVFDGDGAFCGEDLIGLAEPILSGRADHAIGQRLPGAIVLRSADEPGRNSRLHLEAFFNTLVLLILDLAEDPRFQGFDVQCGFHVVSGARCTRLGGRMLPFYGGELRLFFETVRGGGRVVPVNVGLMENPPSRYLVSSVVDEILGLDFIASADREIFERALQLAPSVYRGWPIDAPAFHHEIAELVLARLPAAGRP